MPRSLIEILLVLIVFQGSVFTLFLLTYKNKGKKNSNMLLAALTGLVSVHFLNVILTDNIPQSEYVNINPVIATLYGPVFYYYTRSLIYKDFVLKIKDIKHLFPFAVVFIWAIIKGMLTGGSITDISVIILILLMFYFIISFLEIRKYQKILKVTQSNYDRINLSWIQFAIIWFFAAMFGAGVNYFLNINELHNYSFFAQVFIFGSILLMINGFFFKGLRHPEVFQGVMEEDEKIILSPSKYAYSSLTQSQAEAYKTNLLDYMNNQKPYLKDSLSLNDLAEQLDMPVRHLSQVLNDLLQQNFFEFVNSFRLEEAKKILRSPQNKKITVLEVMYQVGFNSKSSFNTAFKKYTGQTPSEYKKGVD